MTTVGGQPTPTDAGPGASAPPRTAPGQPVRQGRRPQAALAMVGLVLLTGLTLLLGYASKARCTGPLYDETGRSGPDYTTRINRDVCYSDIQHLWIGREIDQHTFPYLNGGITQDGALYGGTLEYPVLSGLLIWAGALFASTDGGFLFGSMVLMLPFGLLTGWLLGRLSGRRALWWALGPPLVLYAFHNWDLPVVACAVGAVYAVHGWRTSRPLIDRAMVAAVLLGLGFAFKLYPGAFVLPLACYVLTRGSAAAGRVGALAPRAMDWIGAARVALAAVLTAAFVNLPFVVAGYQGWRASIAFQQMRNVDLTTNSIWYWGFRPDSDPDNEAFQSAMDWVTPTLVLASFAVAGAAGFWRYRRVGYYPWIGVSAAMLCGFLLLHKVHSPQYTLWLLPFFVLLRLRWTWIVAYLLADLAIGIGIFRWFYSLGLNGGYDVGISQDLAAQAVVIGVWGRAVLLVVLFVLFLTAEPAVPRAREPAPSRA